VERTYKDRAVAASCYRTFQLTLAEYSTATADHRYDTSPYRLNLPLVILILFLPVAINEVDCLMHWNDNSPPSLPSPALPSLQQFVILILQINWSVVTTMKMLYHLKIDTVSYR
jgi:hypothetical protein